MIRSASIKQLMSSVTSGFFFESVATGPEEQIEQVFVKAPLEIIKAVASGAACYLWADVLQHNGIACACATFCVEDDPEASFYLSRTLGERTARALIEFLNEPSTAINFYDELDRLLMVAMVVNSHPPPPRFTADYLCAGVREPTGREIQIFLNLTEQRAASGGGFLKSLALPIVERRAMRHILTDLGFGWGTEASTRYSEQTIIHSFDAGAKLEERTAQALRRVFRREEVFVSPKLATSNRELCDILIVCGDTLVLIEAKAMEVSPKTLRRETERRVAGVKKQLDKAFRQLRGALRSMLSISGKPVGLYASGERVYVNGAFIRVHVAVVISELHPDLSSELWEDQISQAEADEIALHLLDPHEIGELCRVSINEEMFLANLELRWHIAQEKRNLILHALSW